MRSSLAPGWQGQQQGRACALGGEAAETAGNHTANGGWQEGPRSQDGDTETCSERPELSMWHCQTSLKKRDIGNEKDSIQTKMMVCLLHNHFLSRPAKCRRLRQGANALFSGNYKPTRTENCTTEVMRHRHLGRCTSHMYLSAPKSRVVFLSRCITWH